VVVVPAEEEGVGSSVFVPVGSVVVGAVVSVVLVGLDVGVVRDDVALDVCGV
jgi:hypothetical protein